VKVKKTGTIHIPAGKKTGKVFQSMKPGSIAAARIVRITAPGRALINVNGMELSADFLKGVPGSQSLLLRLDERTGSHLTFSIVNQGKVEHFLQAIEEHLIQNDEKTDPFALKQFILKENMSLFQLNLFLLGKKWSPGGPDATIAFLKRFLSVHGREKTTLLMEMFNKNPELAVFFYTLWKNRGIPYNGRKVKPENVEELISLFEDEIESLDETERKDFLKEYASDSEDGIHQLYLLMDESVTAFPYIRRGRSFFISMDYPHLGTIEALIKLEDHRVNVSLYTERKEAGEYLESSRKTIMKNFIKNGIHFKINIHHIKNIVDKISFLHRNYSFNSAFDRKV
jgi:hypothetical protein